MLEYLWLRHDHDQDRATQTIGVWDGCKPAAPKLSPEQAWARAAEGTMETDLR